MPKRIKQTDWAWLAGIIDGEGSIYSRKNRYRHGPMGYQVCLTVGNTDMKMLERCLEITGVGNIYARKLDMRLQARIRQLWSWQTTKGSDVIKVLRAVWPYLTTKRQQAAVAFNWPSVAVNQSNTHPLRFILKETIAKALSALKHGLNWPRECGRI